MYDGVSIEHNELREKTILTLIVKLVTTQRDQTE